MALYIVITALKFTGQGVSKPMKDRTKGKLLLFAFLLALSASLLPIPSAAAQGAEDSTFLIINKSANEMAYFEDGILVNVFPVATGRHPKATPEGIFPIVNKIKNRPYYTDNIPGGDPRNPLGDRWLGLHVGNTVGTTYAIHGNNNEDSIGKYVSKGCVRMHNDDIHWLFERVPLQTKVLITASDSSFESLAVQHGFQIQAPYQGELYINGSKTNLDHAIIEFRSRTYLPLREIVQLLGGKVTWDQRAKTVTAEVEGREVVHQAATSQLAVNGRPFEMTVKSRNWNGTIMMPIRDFVKALGWNVKWEKQTGKIHLTDP